MSEQRKEHKSKIGGQALIEGVMMKGIYHSAMACRLPDGEIDVEVWDEKNGKNMPWYRKTPIIRGSFNFVSSMTDGYRCLMKSAEKQMTDDGSGEEPETKLDKWLDEHIGEKFMSFGFALCLFLFKFLPMKAVSLMGGFLTDRIAKTFVEGIIKIAIFVGYLAVIAQMKDMKRTYEYHGAEHKTIACYEAGDELTVENVKKYTRFHPRCGTSFMIITLLVSIFVFCFIPWTSMLTRFITQIILLPLIVGISYEFIKLAGRTNNVFTRIISAPGLWVQRLTTREPDGEEIAVAIEAMKPCIPENPEDDQW